MIKQETDIEKMLRRALEKALVFFDCDRVWLFYPCDPDAPTFRVPMEITRPEYPGAKVLNIDLPMPPDMARNLREALLSVDPVIYIAGTKKPINRLTAEKFGVQSQMMVALYPKLGKPWVFGMHQCSFPRIWTPEEQRLFSEIGRRISDGLSNVLFLRELQESEDRYRSLFDNSIDAVMLTVPDGTILAANPAACRMFGRTEAEICALGRDGFLDASDPRLKTLLEERARTGRASGELTFVRKDGSRFPGEVSSLVFKDKEGNLRTSMIVRDITERRKLEDQLRQSQKMEAIGQLAGGVAHDFNNILTAIMGYAYVLQMKMGKDDLLKKEIDQIIASASRAANLTQSLLTFSRKQAINPEPIDLCETVRHVERFLHRLIGEDVTFDIKVATDAVWVMADHNQIEQVLVNLATNARDAMPDGGLLSIEAGRVELDKEFVAKHGYGKSGNYALLSVSDTGMGMDENTQKKIFEPFFTTKEVGKGTGLGLAIVYGAIKQHEGFINVYSEPGKGTTFRIYLPLIAASAAKAQPEQVIAPARGTETVLLAEDDEAARTLSTLVLEQFGYQVIAAKDGAEAVEKFIANKDRIKLVILDVIMPKKNARQAYNEIRKLAPEIKTLFTSGYTADVIHKHGILDKGRDFLSKPASPTVFLRKVREVLDRT